MKFLSESKNIHKTWLSFKWIFVSFTRRWIYVYKIKKKDDLYEISTTHQMLLWRKYLNRWIRLEDRYVQLSLHFGSTVSHYASDIFYLKNLWTIQDQVAWWKSKCTYFIWHMRYSLLMVIKDLIPGTIKFVPNYIRNDHIWFSFCSYLNKYLWEIKHLLDKSEKEKRNNKNH